MSLFYDYLFLRGTLMGAGETHGWDLGKMVSSTYSKGRVLFSYEAAGYNLIGKKMAMM